MEIVKKGAAIAAPFFTIIRIAGNAFLCPVQVDYIIAGQGIAGTLLAWRLLEQGQNILVYDRGTGQNSSTIASGLINPVTGKRLVKTWMYDELLSSALDTYRQLEGVLNQPLVKKSSVQQMFATREERELFDARVRELPDLLRDGKEHSAYFHYHNGAGSIEPCYIVDGSALLAGMRSKLLSMDALVEESFDWNACELTSTGVYYKGITAKVAISCEGANAVYNPYFSLLPFSLNKGEAIIASIPDLPSSYVYHQGIKLLPLNDDLFWVGSSFDWNFKDEQPTDIFREKVEAHLKYWLKLPYRIISHLAAIRPSAVDHKVFCGVHPQYGQLAMLNGLGTKGYSLAPYFSAQLADNLVNHRAILPQADISRFRRILSR